MKKKTPNPVDVHVGSRVRARRMMIGMSQEALGEKLDLSFQQVQKYEKGTNRIGSSRLWHIANILQVPVESFFEGLEYNGGETPISEPVDAHTLVLASKIRKFTPRAEKLLLGLVGEIEGVGK